MAFWTEHPKWVQNPKFTASPLLSYGSPPRCRITLDRQDFFIWCYFLLRNATFRACAKQAYTIVRSLLQSKFFIKESKWIFERALFSLSKKQLDFGRKSEYRRKSDNVHFQRNYPWLTCRNFGQCGCQIEKESKMAGEKNRMQLGPLCSLYWS